MTSRPVDAPGRISLGGNLSDTAADLIRQRILTGALRGGDFLRPESIAQELGVSVTPVREALMSVAADGLIQQLPRRGFQVIELTGRDIEDVFCVQALLAGELAARATTRMSDETLQQLVEGHQRHLDGIDGPPMATLDEEGFDFHRTINRAADSPRLMHFMRASLRWAPRRFYASQADWAEQSDQEHHVILEALRARDPEAARTAMAVHLQKAGERLAQNLEQLRRQ